MQGFMKVLARTWLATTVFLVTSTAIWCVWLSWNSAKGSILPIIIIAPLVWWWLVARKLPAKPVRGLAAGALIGIATQVLPDVLPMIWGSVAHPGPRNGEEQTMAIAGAYFYMIVGIGAGLIGALLGLVTATIQRMTENWVNTSA